MSYECSFTLTIAGGFSFAGIIKGLIASGWSPGKEAGGVMYSIPDSKGDPECRTAQPGDLGRVIGELEQAAQTGQYTGIHLMLDDADISVSVEAQTSPGELHVSIYSIRHVLAAAPPVTDHNWYLERLIPPIRAAGYHTRNLVWKEQGS